MRNEKQIQTFCDEVARASWQALNRTYQDYLDANRTDDDQTEEDINEACDCDIYLYIYSSGHWTIDGAQYLQDHRNIVAAISLHRVANAEELASEIFEAYDPDSEDADDTAEEETESRINCDQCQALILSHGLPSVSVLIAAAPSIRTILAAQPIAITISCTDDGLNGRNTGGYSGICNTEEDSNLEQRTLALRQ